MLTHLTDSLTILITSLYVHTSLAGILLAMAIESCCIPLPSEIVMPLAGVMVASGKILQGMNVGLSLFLVALAGATGCLIGSIAAYSIGSSGGRPLMLKYGRYLLISQHDADRADHFFQKWGSATAFFSRLLPVVRTYISLPAGISKMPFAKFCLYTFLGSLPWCLLLSYVGYLLGNHLSELAPIFHGLDVVILFVAVVLVVLYVWRHIRNDRKARAAHAAVDAASAFASQANPVAWNGSQQGWGQSAQSPQPQSNGWGQPQQPQPQQQPSQAAWGQPQTQQGWGQSPFPQPPQSPQSPQPPQSPQQPSQWSQFQQQPQWGQGQPPVQPQQGWGQPQQPQPSQQPQYPQSPQQQPQWGQGQPQAWPPQSGR